MMYEITDYQGNKLQLPTDKAVKAAGVAELLEIEVNGQIHYLNPKNIASIKPVQPGIDREANREQLRKMGGDDSLPSGLEETA